LQAWDDAHNKHDVESLRKIYAPTVDFYGQKLPLEKVLSTKSQTILLHAAEQAA
jgi:hypothetical protein